MHRNSNSCSQKRRAFRNYTHIHTQTRHTTHDTRYARKCTSRIASDLLLAFAQSALHSTLTQRRLTLTTSAKTGDNVDRAFEMCTDVIIDRVNKGLLTSVRTPGKLRSVRILRPLLPRVCVCVCLWLCVPVRVYVCVSLYVLHVLRVVHTPPTVDVVCKCVLRDACVMLTSLQMPDAPAEGGGCCS